MVCATVEKHAASIALPFIALQILWVSVVRLMFFPTMGTDNPYHLIGGDRCDFHVTIHSGRSWARRANSQTAPIADTSPLQSKQRHSAYTPN